MHSELRLLKASMLILTCGSAGADTIDVLELIKGKTLSSDVADVVIHPDGHISGAFAGIEFQGQWLVEAGKYCRILTKGIVAPKECQDLHEVMGESGGVVAVDFIRDDVPTRYFLK